MTTPDEPTSEPALAEPPPVEPTGGAGTMPLDPDQSTVSQDPTPDLDEAEHAALLAMAGGVTAHQILSWEASQIGTGEHPPGSNHTIYSLWGDGPWCFYFQSFAFRHFGALDLIFGAHGYVPDFRSIFAPHGEFHTSSPRPGDLVAFDFNGNGEPEHIGIVEKVLSGSYIQTIEGNTSDHVMRRTRYRGYVYGYATPKYGSVPAPGPTPTPTTEDEMYRDSIPAGKGPAAPILCANNKKIYFGWDNTLTLTDPPVERQAPAVFRVAMHQSGRKGQVEKEVTVGAALTDTKGWADNVGVDLPSSCDRIDIVRLDDGTRPVGLCVI